MDSGVSYHSENLQNTDTTEGSIENGEEHFMELLAAREFKAIRSILNVMNAVDIASLLSEFEEKELAQAFRLIPKAKAAEVLPI